MASCTVEMFLNFSADLNGTDRGGQTALRTAAALKQGANMVGSNPDGATPLHYEDYPSFL